jgi:hypothetical protein
VLLLVPADVQIHVDAQLIAATIAELTATIAAKQLRLAHVRFAVKSGFQLVRPKKFNAHACVVKQFAKKFLTAAQHTSASNDARRLTTAAPNGFANKNVGKFATKRAALYVSKNAKQLTTAAHVGFANKNASKFLAARLVGSAKPKLARFLTPFAKKYAK